WLRDRRTGKRAGMSERRGRPVSWVAVGIIIAGFTLGGFALVFGQWWLFWTAVGVVVVGGIVAAVVDVFADVVLDPIHAEQAEPFVSPTQGEVTAESPDQLEPNMFGQAPSVSDDLDD